jgi:sulfate permease, SulP family
MLKDYTPKTFVCLKEGYTKKLFVDDLLAGLTVGVIALPLALAFAIGSGVEPARGLFTAIIAGFLISLLGGSRVQIGGPTGAFVIIIYSIVQRHGYDGLAIATLLAGIMIALLGIARGGVLLKFIPYPVTTGFTTGIALVIFSSQIKDFLGLNIDSLHPEFLQKCKQYCLFAHTWNPWAFGLAGVSLAIIFILRHFFPRLPGVILVVIAATALVYFFQLPIVTIEDKFGEIPRTLPLPSFPTFSYAKMIEVFPDAISIALLGAIESLLCAMVADGMTGQRHRSNCELVGQGIANIGSVLFGGIPATGAIARTAANIRMGAKTPFAGMIHAITLLLLMLFFAPVAAKIPLCVLSAVLIFVAYNMSEIPHFVQILKSRSYEAVVLIITFLLTVLVDLTVAVQIGVLLAALLFVKHMTDATTLDVCKILAEENMHEAPSMRDGDLLFRKNIPDDVRIFEIKGPFFYAVSHLLEDALAQLTENPRYFILRMQKVPLIDSTGVKALKSFAAKCQQKNIILLLSGVNHDLAQTMHKNNIEHAIGKKHIFLSIEEALDYAKKGLS